MKDYEIYSTMKVPKNSSIIIRLDGRKFHSLSKALDLVKPFDENFYKIITNVCLDIFNQFAPKFIYAFSDEISILLDEIPFSGRVEKINSVFASLASSSFTYNLLNDYSNEFN
jgi:tRNA(His) 5'-end guanylyltransferase